LPSSRTSAADPLDDPLTWGLERKIRTGARGAVQDRQVAAGQGWRVLDVVCTCGPGDRRYQEEHAWASVSLVLSGTFSYRNRQGPLLMSPGAWLLGQPGSSFECSHEHGEGDRCLSFQFDTALFERLAHDSGSSPGVLARARLPPLRALAPLAARAAATLNGAPDSLEEIGLELAGAVLRLASHDPRGDRPVTTARDRGRIARLLRQLEFTADQPHALADLARDAGLSRYHFLRTFKEATGITPHQWLLRARLREAARRLVDTPAPVTEIALAVGFHDLSNFIRSFRSEFGRSPTRFRASRASRPDPAGWAR